MDRFTLAEEEPYEPLRVDPAIEQEQIAKLTELRTQRDNDAVTRSLASLPQAVEGTASVLYAMREALCARATIGEACRTLRNVWGVFKPTERL